jgi:transposase
MSKEKSIEVQVKNVRKKYTPEFKEQALELIKRDGVAKVARDLGLPESMLYSWRTKRAQSGQTFEVQKLQQAETAHLKREVARLQEELEFLKKAAAYFAKESKQGTRS